jgi:hypothetical protein
VPDDDRSAELARKSALVSSHGVAADRDIAITAYEGSVAAGAITGAVTVNHHREIQRRPEAPGTPVRLDPRPAFLAGRGALLSELHDRLTSTEAGPRVVVLSGLGGAGKTSMAVEYAYQHEDELGVCWQLRAEDPAQLRVDFGTLAAELGARDVADARDPVASVHSVLRRAGDDWLLIFDNARDQASVERFLPPAGPGRVLITSQSQHWPHGQALDVPTLDTETAAAFLTSRTGDPDHEAAREVAAALDGLPLALEQAAAYMRATGRSLAHYLELLLTRQADLLSRGEAAGHRETVAATVQLALDRLSADAPAAAALLRLLAYLAPDPVPLYLLLTARPPGDLPVGEPPELTPPLRDDLAADDAVTALRRYSLVSPVVDGQVLVHRLVQSITRSQLPPEAASQYAWTAIVLVSAAVPSDATLPEAWPACERLLPHARAVLPMSGTLLDLTSTVLGHVAQFLGFSGNHLAARDLCQQIVDACTADEAYGPDHPSTLSARHGVAHWTGKLGDTSGARIQYAALLPDFERVLDPDHPSTLATRHGLAYWTGESGDAMGARDQYAIVLAAEERILWPDHPDTLNTRHELARWTGESGDASGARDQFAALLPDKVRVLGPDHPDTLSARHELARWTGVLGDASGARDQFAALLPDKVRVLGPDHPDTLITRYELACWMGVSGNAASARDQCTAVLAAEERTLGPDHPSTLTTRVSLAHWTEEAKRQG